MATFGIVDHYDDDQTE